MFENETDEAGMETPEWEWELAHQDYTHRHKSGEEEERDVNMEAMFEERCLSCETCGKVYCLKH